MSAPTPLRPGFVRHRFAVLARKTKDGPQARRLLALAAIYDGGNAPEAAKIGSVSGLQIHPDGCALQTPRGPGRLLDWQVDRTAVQAQPTLSGRPSPDMIET